MEKSIKSIIFLFLLVLILTIPYFVFASAALNNLEMVGGNSGYNPDVDEYTAAEIAGTVVNIFFSILGIIFTTLMLYGGYNWMIAAGDNSKVEKAKDTIKRAIIGLIITVAAYAICEFVFLRLLLDAGVFGIEI